MLSQGLANCAVIDDDCAVAVLTGADGVVYLSNLPMLQSRSIIRAAVAKLNGRKIKNESVDFRFDDDHERAAKKPCLTCLAVTPKKYFHKLNRPVLLLRGKHTSVSLCKRR